TKRDQYSVFWADDCLSVADAYIPYIDDGSAEYHFRAAHFEIRIIHGIRKYGRIFDVSETLIIHHIFRFPVVFTVNRCDIRIFHVVGTNRADDTISTEIHIGNINSSAVPLADFFAFPIAGQRSNDLTVINFIIQLRHTAKWNPLMLIHTQLIRHMQLITVDFLPVKKDDRLKLHTKVFSDPLDDFPRHLTIKVSGQYPGHIRHHGKPSCIGVYRILEDVCRVPILWAEVANRQTVQHILEEYMSTSDGNRFINMA